MGERTSVTCGREKQGRDRHFKWTSSVRRIADEHLGRVPKVRPDGSTHAQTRRHRCGLRFEPASNATAMMQALWLRFKSCALARPLGQGWAWNKGRRSRGGLGMGARAACSSAGSGIATTSPARASGETDTSRAERCTHSLQSRHWRVLEGV